MSILFQPIRTYALKTLLLGPTLLLCLFAAPPFATASDVVLIRDSEIKPYREAIEGFKSTCNCTVREMGLADLGALENAIVSGPPAIVTVGTRAFRKVRAINDIPVIYTMVMPSETTDAGANTSGVCMEVPPERYLSTMLRLFPAAKRIGLLFDPERTGAYVRRAAALAAEKGLTLVPEKLHDPRQAPALLDQLKGKVDVLWMLPDATVVNAETVDYLMLFSFRNNIPIFSFSEKYVEKGAVAALRIDPRDMGAQAGEMARALLEGGQNRVHAFARAPRLVVNMKIIAKIGAAINGELVRDAEKVE